MKYDNYETIKFYYYFMRLQIQKEKFRCDIKNEPLMSPFGLENVMHTRFIRSEVDGFINFIGGHK